MVGQLYVKNALISSRNNFAIIYKILALDNFTQLIFPLVPVQFIYLQDIFTGKKQEHKIQKD